MMTFLANRCVSALTKHANQARALCAAAQPAKMKAVEVYRYDPDSSEGPRMQTYQVRI